MSGELYTKKVKSFNITEKVTWSHVICKKVTTRDATSKLKKRTWNWPQVSVWQREAKEYQTYMVYTHTQKKKKLNLVLLLGLKVH